MSKRVLVVDDDPSFIRLVEQILTRREYDVFKAGNGREGLQLMFSEKPDLVLLDIAMPGMDGWQACRRIREFCNTPIIMLTGQHSTEEEIVRGFDCGADDYLIKPVGNKELIARVRAVLRRAESPSSSEGIRKTTYSDSWLTVNLPKHKVTVDGNHVRLTPTEFRLLGLLLQNADHVLAHKQLLEGVWGWEYTDDIDHVRIYIWHLRRKIESDSAHPRYIITEPGVGYYFRKAV